MKDKQPNPLSKESKLNNVNATFSSVMDEMEDPEELARKYDRIIAVILILVSLVFVTSMAFIYDRKLNTIIKNTETLEKKITISAKNKDGEQVEVSLQQAFAGLYQQCMK